MALIRLAIGVFLLGAYGGLSRSAEIEGDTPADLVAQYRKIVEIEDNLSPSPKYDRERWDLDAKLDKLRSSLQPAGDLWWQGHREQQISSLSDDELLAVLAYRGTGMSDPVDPRELAAISEALKRGTFASIIQEWNWVTLDGVKDAQLEKLWTDHLHHFIFTASRNRELMLTEMVRRGGAMWKVFLEGQLAQREADLKNDDLRGLWRQLDSELPLVVALRRLERKPDPLAVELSEASYESTFPELPMVVASLVNVDTQAFTIQVGGDYRSGRLARWRFEVKDAGGKLMPQCDWFGMMGGGLSTARVLKPNEQMKYELPAANYITPLPPGEYTLRVQFHNRESIADLSDISGLVLVSSKEVRLKVIPGVLRNGAAKRKQAEAWIAKLPEAGSTKIVGGTYGKWAYEFVPPDSAQGRLLAMGLDALPSLIDAAGDRATSEGRRAAILGILYSATGTNAPQSEEGVLGPSEVRRGPWAISWGGGMGIGGVTVESYFGNANDSKMDSAKQLALAARWRTWARGTGHRSAGR
jgi:hypothetical protein